MLFLMIKHAVQYWELYRKYQLFKAFVKFIAAEKNYDFV